MGHICADTTIAAAAWSRRPLNVNSAFSPISGIVSLMLLSGDKVKRKANAVINHNKTTGFAHKKRSVKFGAWHVIACLRWLISMFIARTGTAYPDQGFAGCTSRQRLPRPFRYESDVPQMTELQEAISDHAAQYVSTIMDFVLGDVTWAGMPRFQTTALLSRWRKCVFLLLASRSFLCK